MIEVRYESVVAKTLKRVQSGVTPRRAVSLYTALTPRIDSVSQTLRGINTPRMSIQASLCTG